MTLLVWFLAQTLKVLLSIFREKKLNFKWFIGTGGMPSSHAAGSAAMATTCGLEQGFHSPIFAMATIFALVVMFDAQSSRRSTGQQAEVLNQMMDDMYWKGRIESKRLKEFIGHTPIQVITGAILGVVTVLLIYP